MDGAPRGRERRVGFGGGWELTSQNKTGEAQKTKYLIKGPVLNFILNYS